MSKNLVLTLKVIKITKTSFNFSILGQIQAGSGFKIKKTGSMIRWKIVWIRNTEFFRIRIKRYKMKGKAEFNKQFFGVFFSQDIIFFKSEPKKVANF